LILFLIPLPPINIGELPERVFDVCVVEPDWDEPSILVGRIAEDCSVAFQGHPIGGKCILAHDKQQRSRRFQSPFNGQEDGISGLDHPIIKPNSEPICPQSVG
jgi:hypothetical protein